MPPLETYVPVSNFEILLCKNHSIGSWFLRAVMWSRFSHSAIHDVENGWVYDTTLWAHGWKFWKGGVKRHTLEDFRRKYPTIDARECPVDARTAPEARKWLEAQLGKGYDLEALVGFLFQRNWSDPSRWFCSEMSETFRTLFSVAKLRVGMWRVTPHHQDILA